MIFVSREFPEYHSKKGEKTCFVELIKAGLKRHTFRGNYKLWAKRIDEINAGNAVLVLKYHTLGRYVKGNQQVEFARFDSDSGIGIEQVRFIDDVKDYADLVNKDGTVTHFLHLPLVAQNDGLEFSDFREWFDKGDYDLKEPFACIHFTGFRYSN